MTKKTFAFPSASVTYYFDSSFEALEKLVSKESAIIITDDNVSASSKRRFKGWKTIVIPHGEGNKVQSTVDHIVEQLIELGADRKTILIGVGGGVVTDITGYVAGIFMRGIQCAFVPTTILAMVDAAIGGKNGVDVGKYKNMVGLIRQPQFLLYDYSFLKTLPKEEWVNGFAEIIKHAAIKDAAMFAELEEADISYYRKDVAAIATLIKRNALLKTKVVIADETEQGDRKLLNFGHSFGHAIENLYNIPHGHAVSIGMGVACKMSWSIIGFKETLRLGNLLKRYGLPPDFHFDHEETYRLLTSDKKKVNQEINFILLQKIGKAVIKPLPLEQVKSFMETI